MKNIYGALRIGTLITGINNISFYVYSESISLIKDENIIKVGFKTKEDANFWIDNNCL